MEIRWVNAYDHNRAYGGPEEGGWWFDTGVFLSSIACRTDEEVDFAKAYFHRIYDPRFEGHHDISSVICEGVLQITVDDEPGADYPTERPHYE